MYVLSTGCQWRAIPRTCHAQHVHDYFDLWAWDGTLDRIHHALYVQCREWPTENQPERRHHRQSKRQGAEKGGVD